ncbi:zf-HC2 domain-containing protein [Lentibacillus sp. N15]|uniref:zf-HC2 domain-containing protein n=1 Tax=Lentibacillus songyuanensis TaxID=3136161 RepID=UPI0031BA78AD
MESDHQAIKLMHKYFDGDLRKTEEVWLLHHLENCHSCQRHFHELKRTITWIQSSEPIEAPHDFTKRVMEKLPQEKKHVGYKRWLKAHPIITAAALFIVVLFGGLVSAWNHDNQLVVSKQDNLIIDGDTVIVPEGVTVSGDLLVKNGDLRIDGTIDGDVTLINGKLINENIGEDDLVATVGGVHGEFKQVNQVFDWIWYKLKHIFVAAFSFE